MNSIHKLHRVTYLVLTLLTIILAIASIISAASGSIDIFTGGLAAFVFIVFAILQIACISVYQPAFTPYKIGFYLMHLGLLILLSGLAAFELAGFDQTVSVPVNENGSFYSSIRNENGEEEDLGFSFRINSFRVDKYESGSDKYYRADVEFLDPATLRQSKEYLEVNRTLRQNGKKIYLMDYSDGFKSLAGQYGLTANSFYEVYASHGSESGYDLLSLVYQDIAGTRYAYYLYDSVNSRFLSVSAEEIALLSGNLWAYTVKEDSFVTVYLTTIDGSFTETLTANGKDVIAHIAQTYPDKRVSYYYYTMDQGVVTPLFDPSMEGDRENPVETFGEVFAGIRVSDVGVSVYLMKEELHTGTPITSNEGGSALLSKLSDQWGAPSGGVSYMLYTPSAGGYVKVTENEIASLDGELRGYALNMGDSALIYVHPLSVVLMIKQDPGEYATLAGMILVILGSILMCLVRGKRKKGSYGDFEAHESASPVTRSASATKPAPASKASSNGKASNIRSKGGKK